MREVSADDGDPIALVVSLNLHRRHLTESQRALVGAQIATLAHGTNQHLPIGNSSVTYDQAATLLNVGKRSISRAHDVLHHGVPELTQAVQRGEMAVSTAANLSRLPADTQREVLTKTPRRSAPSPAR